LTSDTGQSFATVEVVHARGLGNELAARTGSDRHAREPARAVPRLSALGTATTTAAHETVGAVTVHLTLVAKGYDVTLPATEDHEQRDIQPEHRARIHEHLPRLLGFRYRQSLFLSK
jgi:hypothetical protein